jgi:hypothetical protein
MMQVHNDFFQLPLTFEQDQLLSDLAICEKYHWVAHYNTNDYNGDWKAIALRSSNGDAENVLAHDAALFINTPLLNQCPYFSEIIGAFHCELETVRLLALAPGSFIKEHRDRGLSYAEGFFRLHIPITTDEKVEFMVNGHLLNMLPGECWYANFDLPHSVNHLGTTRRIHLVIDGKRNAWTDALFDNAGYHFELEKTKKRLDTNTVQEMIQHLNAMGTATADKLVADLKKDYSL